MTLERITKNNIDYAIQIQEELFPGESGRANFEESVDEKSGFEYYLLYEGGDCVGVIGIYSYPEDHESAWLMAASRGYLYARLYTDAMNNDAAIAFYKVNGYIDEPYQNLKDSACMKYKTVVFSKALKSRPLELWNNRNIHLTEQIAKQEKYGKGAV